MIDVGAVVENLTAESPPVSSSYAARCASVVDTVLGRVIGAGRGSMREWTTARENRVV